MPGSVTFLKRCQALVPSISAASSCSTGTALIAADSTTISIATLKVFDIVRTMTAGNFDTSVIANEMYTQAFRAGEQGRGAALAIVLFLLVLPIVIYNVRVLRQQREIR